MIFLIKKNQLGFTLIETVLVVSLVAILAFTAIPALINTNTVSLDAAVKKLETDIQYAQNLATTTGDSYGFRNIDDANNTNYEIYEVGTGNAVTSPYHHNPMQEDFADSFDGVSFQSNNHDIRFDKDGTPTFVSGGSSIAIVNTSSETKTISINSSGLISTQ